METVSRGNLMGQKWSILLDVFKNSETEEPEDDEGEVYQPDSLSHLGDVTKLKRSYMHVFGRLPETDHFCTVVCSICSMVVVPQMLKYHMEKWHSDVDKLTQSLADKSLLDSPKSKIAKKLIAKLEGKPKKTKSSSSSPPDLTEEGKRLEKKKSHSPERTVPPELEPMSQLLPVIRTDKRKQKLVDITVKNEIQPAPILNSIKETEKDTKKKKKDRRPDKIYDPNKHCGVHNEQGKPCLRSILCKMHPVALKRAVADRSMPYDKLIKILKYQQDEEKRPMPNPAALLPSDDVRLKQMVSNKSAISGWTPVAVVAADQQQVVHVLSEDEPLLKRIKLEEDEEVVVDIKHEPFVVTPFTPQAEPILRWASVPNDEDQIIDFESAFPHYSLEDVSWHSSHPKPLAVNTFGSRMVGGLMSTSKNLDFMRRNLQTAWSTSAGSVRNNSQNLYTINNNGLDDMRRSTFNNRSAQVKKKMKLNLPSGGQEVSEIMPGLSLANNSPAPRPAMIASVPVRVLQGSLPLMETTAFIQVNLCPPK